jgi:uncharacterized membrane protein
MSNGIRVFSAGPLSVLAILLLIGLIIVIIPLLFLGLVGAAFTKLGFSWITALAVVLLILFGSTVNIPVYRMKRDVVRIAHNDSSLYLTGAFSVSDQAWESVISLNLGGAIIPVCVSVYLLYSATTIGALSLLSMLPLVGMGVIFVTLVSFVATGVMPGIGIRVPILIPALTALLAGILLSGGTGLSAAVIAFVSGVSGTLLGGNILQIFKIKDLEEPGMNIGGSGTFATIFICCILPALIA